MEGCGFSNLKGAKEAKEAYRLRRLPEPHLICQDGPGHLQRKAGGCRRL